MLNKSDLFVSKLLTQQSLAYGNDNYVAEKLMPIVQVKKDTAEIAVYGMDNLRVVEAIRAQGSGANEVGHTVSIDRLYSLKDHALKQMVTMEEVDNADKPINPQRDAMENLMDRMLVIKEKTLADVMNSTSVITQNTTLSGTDQWSDYDNSDPIDDISVGMEVIRKGSGKKPNTFNIAYDVMLTLLQHPQILARFPGKDSITAGDVATLFPKIFPGITNVVVGDAQYNSGLEGKPDVLTDIWTSNFWILYVESKPRLKSRSFGFTYQKGKARRVKILKWDEDKEGQFVRVNDKNDQKIVDVKCAYLIKDAI